MDNATKALAKHEPHPARLPHGRDLAGQHAVGAALQGAEDGALKTFDFVVANPPFSTKAWTNGFDPANDQYGRFALGVPPPKNGDYAFLLHILASLKSTGKGAIILPHGVLFRGGAEASIRREIVKRGFIKGIIGLPANLFYGTGIPACILVLDKEGAAARKGIFMIDASKGFIKDGNKNRLRAQDIHKIVDAFTRQLELPRYSRMVPLAEISDPKNDFNLNLPRYIDASEPEDIQDIDGHLRGGIPDRDLDALEAYWKVFPGVREALFKKAGRPGYSELKVAATDIKSTIFGHAEFTAWSTQTKKLFARWRSRDGATACTRSRRGTSPRRSSSRSPRSSSRRSRRPSSSTPTTCTSTSWTTGPRPCRTTSTSSPATAGARPPSRGRWSRTRSPRTSPTSRSASRSGRPS
jgi:type I restriction enzyme M protein